MDKLTVMLDRVKLQLVCGDITHEGTDAIINTTDFSNSQSGLSKAILSAAGPAVQAELDQVGIPAAHVCTTAPGLLGCREIIHANFKCDLEMIRKNCKNILRHCESKGYHSAAFPAINTDVAYMDPVKACKAMLDGMTSAITDLKPNSLSLIRIVIQEQLVFQAFRSELENRFGQKASHSLNLKGKAKQKLKKWQDKYSRTSTTPAPQESNRKIVILGKTGFGKSSLANTIFGETVFEINNSPESRTSECKSKTKSVNGREITLIDTPGFFDEGKVKEDMKPEIVRCFAECAPGPHAFLIVLKVEKFSEQEKYVIKLLHQYLSEEALKYVTIVFTHRDQLPEGETIKKFVDQSEGLNDLVKKCGGRCHVVDNTSWNESPKDEYRSNRFQVEELLNTIDKMVTEYNGSCYTNEMLQEVEEEIQQEEKQIRLSSGNMTEKEIRKLAEVRASTKLSVRLAGIGAGAMLGALFGVVVLGGLAVIGLRRIVPIQALAHTAAAASGVAAAAGGVAVGGATAGGATAGGVGGIAVGGTAAGGTAAVVGASSLVGAVMGGVTGYHAAEGAGTPLEAAKRAAGAVKNGALFVLDEANDVVDKILWPKVKQS